MSNYNIIKSQSNLLKKVEDTIGITNKLLNLEFRKINAVYFDDHLIYLKGVKNALKLFLPNICVEEFIEGSKALIYVENCYKENESLDIIITGIKQSVYNGFDFSKSVRGIQRKYNANTPILIISMCVGEELVLEINKALSDRLFNAAISKAASPEQISEYIKFLLKNPNEIINYEEDSNVRQKELELLKLLCKNYDVTEISQRIDLSSRTIEALKSRIMKRYGVTNLEALISYVKKNKLFDDI